MYHVSKDIRARKSAELICKGLERCLAEKPLSKIRVNDIYQKSYVSRATFYRLFDNIIDVLAYECDHVFSDIISLIETRSFRDMNEQVQFCISRWLTHKVLIQALVENNLGHIIYDSHVRNAELVKKLYSIPFEDERQSDYFISILSALTYAALGVYFRHGAEESAEEVYRTVCECASIISHSFNREK